MRIRKENGTLALLLLFLLLLLHLTCRGCSSSNTQRSSCAPQKFHCAIVSDGLSSSTFLQRRLGNDPIGHAGRCHGLFEHVQIVQEYIRVHHYQSEWLTRLQER